MNYRRAEELADRDTPASLIEQIELLQAAMSVHAARSSWGDLIAHTGTWEEEDVGLVQGR